MGKLKLRHGRKYFSPSQLKKLYVSISSLVGYLNRVWESSSSMDLGTAVHSALLEPEKFDEIYYVLDDSKVKEKIGGARPTSTAKYRRWLSFVSHLMRNKKALSAEDMEKINRIRKNCKDTGVSDTYFTGGEAEKTIQGVVKNYNEDFDALCIIDYDTDFMSVDLKTTSKPLSKFKWDANELGYDIQSVITNSLNQKEFVFVVVQTVEPFDIGIYTCSDYFMNRGRDKVNKALSNYENYKDETSTQVLTFEL